MSPTSCYCLSGDGYQPLIGLQDIKKLQHLTEDAVRDILRSAHRDSDLKIVSMGQLTDMSGTNDAFNSSICSLEVSEPLLASKHFTYFSLPGYRQFVLRRHQGYRVSRG